jgi:hypothetical protein
MFSLGVEFKPDGGMTLRYLKQDWSGNTQDQANFTPADVKKMRAIAYGPLLQEMNIEKTILFRLYGVFCIISKSLEYNRIIQSESPF